jgi:hypothetical protein
VAHIREKIDFAVTVLLVRQRQVLVAHHRRPNAWLPLGGPIELDELPRASAVSQNCQYLSPAVESGSGLPHSKTLRVSWHIGERARVLECASALALWHSNVQAIVRRHTGSDTAKWPCRRALAEVAD